MSTTTPDYIIAFLPADHEGTKREARKVVSRSTGIPQTRVRVERPDEASIEGEARRRNLVPLAQWRDYPHVYRNQAPFVVVTGVDLYEGHLSH